jgi:hypothetical protein
MDGRRQEPELEIPELLNRTQNTPISIKGRIRNFDEGGRPRDETFIRRVCHGGDLQDRSNGGPEVARRIPGSDSLKKPRLRYAPSRLRHP